MLCGNTIGPVSRGPACPVYAARLRRGAGSGLRRMRGRGSHRQPSFEKRRPGGQGDRFVKKNHAIPSSPNFDRARYHRC
jgi:hypothetical protein